MAERVTPKYVTIDMHADTPQRFLDDGWDFTGKLDGGMINLESARRGGLGAEFFAIWVEPTEHAGNFLGRALSLAEATLEQVRRHAGELALCVSPEEIVAAQGEGRFGVLLGLEGGHAIENSLGNLRLFHAMGVRYMTLTWANSNDWADSSGEDARHHGLTEFGCEVIREMNRLGMMVDVSHVSDETFRDVMKVSTAPVIASHSSARAMTDSARNLTDEQMREIAAGGGVAMVNFYPAFLDDTWRVAWNEVKPQRPAIFEAAAKPFREAGMPVPYRVSVEVDRRLTASIARPAMTSLTTHLEHMIRVMGMDHVGLGSDFDGIPVLPEGIDSAADLPKIAAALTDRGHSAEDVAKVMGGNVLRVFGEVQRRAEEIASITSPREG